MNGYQQRRRSWLSGGRFYEAQPAWSKKLWWFVGFPAFLLWGGFIVSGTLNEYQGAALAVFGIAFVVAAVQNFYFFKSLWRGDL